MPTPWQAVTGAISAVVFLLGLWLRTLMLRSEEIFARHQTAILKLEESAIKFREDVAKNDADLAARITKRDADEAEHRHRLELDLQVATSQTALLGSKHTALTDQISKMVTRVEFEGFERQVTIRLDKIDACLERIADEMAARREARK